MPIQRGTLDVYEFGHTTFTVDGTKGARVTGFTMDGTNVLTAATTAWPNYWGSTLWTAPQNDWWQNGVPATYAPIDSAPYVMTVGADTSINAQGSPATFGTKQVAITKTFSVDLQKASVGITYAITNKGAATIRIGHWEVTRVFVGGLSFYPAGAAAPMSYGPITLQKVGAYEWFDESKFPKGTAAKFWADTPAGGGWIAHVMPDTAGDLLFIKTFPDIPAGSAGPGDGSVEIFVQADTSYEEVETHNQLLMIAPGQTVPWTVRWYLRRLPAGTMRTVGNQALVDFVTAQLR
jgi:hypothetical protein